MIKSSVPVEDVHACGTQLVQHSLFDRKPPSWMRNPATHTMLPTPINHYMMVEYTKHMKDVYRFCKQLRLSMKWVKAGNPGIVEEYLDHWSFSFYFNHWTFQGGPRSLTVICASPRNILPLLQVPRTSAVETGFPKHARR